MSYNLEIEGLGHDAFPLSSAGGSLRRVDFFAPTGWSEKSTYRSRGLPSVPPVGTVTADLERSTDQEDRTQQSR
jgi:hypothetical protein